jgi:3-hydroxybutyryl-CoA dehydrogenase
MELLTQFAKRIHQIPIILKKETKGYVFNAMAAGLNPVALSLAANGIATIEEIDRVWMLVMKGSMGPFGFLDEVGLDTVLAINKVKFQENKDNPELQQKVKRNIEFLESYVKQGKLGVKNGEGFYQYPNPRYKDADFLKD